MLTQFLRKRAVIATGFFNSRLNRALGIYDTTVWWDKSFYTDGVSDRQTIHSSKHRLSASYHYASVEQIICRLLFNRRVQSSPRLLGPKSSDSNPFQGCHVLDLGSGSGHWITFYSNLGAERVDGIDISKESVTYLQDQYSDRADVSIYHGMIHEVLAAHQSSYDLINAIGVMFHIVDDEEWHRSLHEISQHINPGGLLIVGGHFGLFDGLDVGLDASRRVFKRLRSKRRWQKTLRKFGFRDITVVRNHAYLHINDPLPENSIMIATRGEGRRVS